ncbi:MAG: XRE family transcriptional regulator [Anaerolineales bacterium]|jgi:transcriptional regulator with XRE-family HTH domain
MTQDRGEIRQTILNVGQKIRRLRERKNLSQQAMAELSGISRNTLSLIERGQSSPTVGTLKRLADALNVDINAFFDTLDRSNIIYTRSEQRQSLQLSECILADLGVGLIEQYVTPLLVRLDPRARSGNPVSHEGQDFVYCLRGNVLFEVGEQSFMLSPGDSLLYDAHLDHGFQNAGTEYAELLIVLSTPQDGLHYISSHSLTSPAPND